MGSYWKSTRHPAPCMLFILPLLAVYEIGVIMVGGPQALAVRNGADAWMRWLLAALGMGNGLFAPIIICCALIFWALRNKSTEPKDVPGAVAGIAFESIALGLGLWVLSRTFGPVLDALGMSIDPLAATPSNEKPPTVGTPLAQMVTYLGAGIYEEVIFRLGVFWGGAMLLQSAMIPKNLATLVMAIVSAVAFAAVHHIGASGEAINGYVFSFRIFAGLLFAGLFVFRGFGITVGTHAFYDVIVGINV